MKPVRLTEELGLDVLYLTRLRGKRALTAEERC